METARDVTPEEALALLRDDLANIRAKVASGKPLTQQERLLIQTRSEGAVEPVKGASVWAKNQSELARILGVERKTIQRWRKEKGHPGAQSNGSYNVPRWREWAKGRGHVFADDDSAVAASTKVKRENIELQNEKLRINNAIRRKEWIPRVVARQVLSQLVLQAKARHFNGVVRLATLARLAPSTADGAEEIRKELEVIWRSLTDSEWYKAE